MATRQNTNNAIPSNDLKDLNDNTIIIDEWTNGTVDYTQDRLGNQIKTRKKVVEDLDAYAQQIADGLFVPLDGSKAATKIKIGTATLTGDDGILKADNVKLLKDGDAVQLTADENGVKTVAEPTTFSGDVNCTGALQNKGSGVVTKATNIFNKVWISEEITPVRGTVHILTHNLNVEPLKCYADVLLKCIVANNSYEVGDYAISFSNAVNSGGIQTLPPTPFLSENQIQYNTGSGDSNNCLYIVKKNNGEPIGIDNTTSDNWRYVFRIFYK